MFAMIAVIAGLLLAGLAIFQALNVIEPPQTYPEYPQYVRTVRLVTLVAFVFIDVAAFLGVLSGALIAVRRSDLPDGVRSAFVLGPLVLAGLWLLAYLLTLRPTYTVLP